MAQTTITNDDIAALATKLDAMADRFDEQERAALHAVFHLAGAAMSDAAVEVEGYRLPVVDPAEFRVTSNAWDSDATLGTSFDGALRGTDSAGPGGGSGNSGSVTIEFSR